MLTGRNPALVGQSEGMDTTHDWGRSRSRSLQPSLRGQLFMLVSVFLCGCVLTGLLFVGVWRHTASAETRAHTAQVGYERQLATTAHALASTRHALATLRAQLAHANGMLVAARRQDAADRASLAQARSATSAVTRALAPDLKSLVDSAGSLAHQTTTLRSELTALERYARSPGPTGVDAGYMQSQAHYLASSADTAATGAATLLAQAQGAQSALARRSP